MKNINHESLINQIMITLICALLFFTNILVGAPTNTNISIINIIVIEIAMIFFIIRKLLKKEKILENKLDIFIFIFCMSPIIPVIFNAYSSLSGSIQYIIRYITIFLVYIMVRDITKNNPKIMRLIINITIISSVILTIIGIDKMSTKFFLPFTRAIGSIEIEYEEIRMNSLFSYANTFAAFCSFGLFLAIGEYLREYRKKIKFLYASGIFIIEVGIILSYSRTVFIILFLLLIFYLILLKKKEKIIDAIFCIIITGLFAILYSNIYMKNLLSGNFIYIWIALFIFAVTTPGILLLCTKIHKYIYSLKIKNIILIASISIILLILILIIGLSRTAPLILFNNTNSNRKVEKEIYRVEENKKYSFVFDIESKSKYENVDIYKISILEKNKYFDNIKQTELMFGNFKGKKEIDIITDEDTTEIFIVFSSEFVDESSYLKINHLWINGNEEALDYQYLPYNLVSKIKNINFNTKSAWERGIFIADAMKLIKDNIFFGIGGDGWQFRQGEVQEYLYGTKEVHCYPIQVFLEFGIIGFISLIGIVILCMKKFYSYLRESNMENKIEIISMAMAILLIFLHSIVDFDMSFLCVSITMFSFLGILNAIIEKKKTCKQTRNIINVVIFIALIPLLGINLLNHKVNTYIERMKKENNIEKKYVILQEINRYPTYLLDVKKENLYLNKRYTQNEENIIKYAEYMLKHERYEEGLNLCSTLIHSYANLKDNGWLEETERLCNIAINIPIKQKYNVMENIERQEIYLNISYFLFKQYHETNEQKLIELADRLSKQVLLEYDETLNRIQDYQKCRYPKQDRDNYVETVKQNYEDAKKYIGEYENEIFGFNVSI